MVDCLTHHQLRILEMIIKNKPMSWKGREFEMNCLRISFERIFSNNPPDHWFRVTDLYRTIKLIALLKILVQPHRACLREKVICGV